MVGGDLSRDSMAVPITVLQGKGANYSKKLKFSGSTLLKDPQLTAETDLKFRDNRILNTVVKTKIV
jgi:hypothetical protein